MQQCTRTCSIRSRAAATRPARAYSRAARSYCPAARKASAALGGGGRASLYVSIVNVGGGVRRGRRAHQSVGGASACTHVNSRPPTASAALDRRPPSPVAAAMSSTTPNLTTHPTQTHKHTHSTQSNTHSPSPCLQCGVAPRLAAAHGRRNIVHDPKQPRGLRDLKRATWAAGLAEQQRSTLGVACACCVCVCVTPLCLTL